MYTQWLFLSASLNPSQTYVVKCVLAFYVYFFNGTKINKY